MDEKNKKEVKNSEERGWLANTYRTYHAEYKKIVWPSWKTLFLKHTVTVIAVSLIFGVYIAVIDGIFGALFSQFVRLVTS